MAANFIKLYEKRFHEKPTAWSAIGFDTAWIAFTAIKNSHYSHDSQKVTKSLKLLHELSLVTAKNFRFSTNNSPDRKLVIYKLSHEGTHYQGEY